MPAGRIYITVHKDGFFSAVTRLGIQGWEQKRRAESPRTETWCPRRDTLAFLKEKRKRIYKK
jgi:hypothetical protein